MKGGQRGRWLNFRGLSHQMPHAEGVHVPDKLERKRSGVRPFYL